MENDGSPQFVITVEETGHADAIFKDSTPKDVWENVLTAVEEQRRQGDFVKIFPEYLSGEYMFGLTEPAIIRIIESVSRGHASYVLLFLLLQCTAGVIAALYGATGWLRVQVWSHTDD